MATMTEEWTSLQDFVDGLVAAGGSADLRDYVYAGGDTDGRQAYFNARYKNSRRQPDHKKACVCSHKIKENCYIENKYTGCLYVVGNVCIKRFMPGGLIRTCSICGTTHKNRKDNLCGKCRDTVVFVKVDRDQIADAKRLEARWNPTMRMWWVHPSNVDAINKFGRFI